MKSYQRGSATAWAIIGVLAVLVIGVFSLYVSASNFGNRTEVQIKAVWEDNENVLSGYTLKVQEMAQIPKMQTEALKEVIKAALSARYGEKGSQATFQWLKEQNPNLDQKTFIKIQQTIESGRDEFKNAQTRLISVKQGYETALGNFWQGKFLFMAGYPKINLADYRIVSDATTQEAFKTHKQAPLKLN